MFDSCACIEMLRGLSDTCGIPPIPHTSISSIVAGELRVAAFKHHYGERRRGQLEAFFSIMPILAFDAEAAGHYADIRAHLEKSGTIIGPMDLLIAAHARSLDATLITINEREFRRVPGLKIIAP